MKQIGWRRGGRLSIEFDWEDTRQRVEAIGWRAIWNLTISKTESVERRDASAAVISNCICPSPVCQPVYCILSSLDFVTPILYRTMSLHPKGKCIIVLLLLLGLVYSLYSDGNNNALFIVLLFYSIVGEFYYRDNNGVFVQQIMCGGV